MYPVLFLSSPILFPTFFLSINSSIIFSSSSSQILVNEIKTKRAQERIMPKNSVIIKRIERDQVQKRDFDLVDYDDETALMMMMRERYNGEIILFI